MARSSKPRRPYQPQEAPFRLVLTRGGMAELIDLETEECVWSSQDDEDFKEEFPDFLEYDDVADILDFLEEIGELTTREADATEIEEEFVDPLALAGMLPDS